MGNPDTRKALLENLSEKGYGFEQLEEIKSMINAEKSGLFDVLAYIAFALSPVERKVRAKTAQLMVSAGYDQKLRVFLDFVLSQYIEEGVHELDVKKLPDLLELKYNGVSDVAEQLGSVKAIRDAFIGFQRHLYF